MTIVPRFNSETYGNELTLELPNDIKKEDFLKALHKALIEKISQKQPSGWPMGVTGLNGNYEFEDWFAKQPKVIT